MKTVSVREFRNTIPHLRETLAEEHELLLVSNGEPVARILPVTPVQVPAAARPVLPSMKAFRDSQPRFDASITDLIRADRDRR